jgi:nucleotide-binding universal stress UspA family protein
LGVPYPTRRTEPDRADREAVVRDQAVELASTGIRVELTVTASTPDILAAALAERAEAMGADAIVVGADLPPAHGASTGRTVTQELVQIAPCPVIVVPPRSSGRQGPPAGWVG